MYRTTVKPMSIKTKGGGNGMPEESFSLDKNKIKKTKKLSANNHEKSITTVVGNTVWA